MTGDEARRISRLRRRLLSETFTSTVATLTAALFAVVAVTVMNSRVDLPPQVATWAAVLTTWLVLTIVHALLTWIGFHGLGGARLREAALGRRHRSRFTRLVTWFLGSGDAPSWSVGLSLLSLIAVSAPILTPSLRAHGLMLVLALALVVASWTNVTVMFAAQYTRLGIRHAAFQFSGESGDFSDYLYLSLAVQASLGAADVQVMTSRARRTVAAHTAVAFVFNTVLVAMSVSLVIAQMM